MITCPAYFGTDEREATANAGRLAGLNVRAILNEPTAAAIAYGLEQGEDQTVLVYDLGGGTFDITMIEIKDRLIRVICTGGDHRLGGALWDEAIVMYLAERVPARRPASSPTRWTIPRSSTTSSSRPSAARRRSPSATRPRSASPTPASRPASSSSGAKFEEITKHLLDRTIELTREMLADARAKGHTKFDKIILVGGATRMPQVRDRIVAEFGMEPESLRPRRGRRQGRRALRPEGVAPGRGQGDPRARPIPDGRRRAAASSTWRPSPRRRWPRPSTSSSASSASP